MNKENKKAIVFYVIGAVLIIISLVKYLNSDTRGIDASAGYIRALYWLIAGCTSLIMGHLTALMDRKQPENKNEQGQVMN